MTTKVRVLVALGQLEPCLSLFDLVLPGQQPKVLNMHADEVAAGLICGDVVLCESCVEVTLFLIETDGRVLVLIGQLEPALSRFLVVLPGQQPKVLESHATCVLVTLVCDTIVLLGAEVVVALPLVATNGRVLVVIGQLEPALSRLLVVLPGQHPKRVESHATFVLATLVCDRIVLLDAEVVVALVLVATNGRVLVVVGQLEPALSRFLTLLPGQHPKVLESHAAFVLATLALVIVNGRVLVVLGQFEPALSRLLTLLPGQQPKVLESHPDFVLAKPSCVTTNDRVLLVVVAQLEPARSRLVTVLPGQQPKLLESHAAFVLVTLVRDAIVLGDVEAVVVLARVNTLVVIGQLDPTLSRLVVVVPGQQPKVLDSQAAFVLVTLVRDAIVLLDAEVVVALVLVATNDPVPVVAGQFEPALSRLLVALPGQQPKVLESHAAFVLATLMRDAIVLLDAVGLLDAEVVEALALVATNGRVLVVAQLEPALLRLLVVLSGQQPKVLE